MKSHKFITIEINYRTHTDLKTQLALVLENAKAGTETFSKKVDSNKVEYELQFLNELHFEEKVIDGKLTMVIQSKMNKK